MKKLTLCSLVALAMGCAPSEKKELEAKQDSIGSVIDTTRTPVLAAQALSQTTETLLNGALAIKGEDTILTVENQWAFVSDPYDFSLDVSTIKDLLGDGAVSTEENFEGGEDYGPYSYYTITYVDPVWSRESTMSFYSYSGKHFCTIVTPLLPLKKGIAIGMSKQSFLEAMNFTGDSTARANLFTLLADYGSMDFRFRADTLNLISAYYEEGD